MGKYLLWDFDGTLGYRVDGLKGRAWSMSLYEAIQLHDPFTKITHDDVYALIDRGFPWHEPDVAHTHLNNPELWWEHMTQLFQSIYEQLGYRPHVALLMANEVREIFIDLEKWELFDDVMDTLEQLNEMGWKHIVVSNHVPELKQIIQHLGFEHLLIDIINSAEVGYEKPNPMIFKRALEKTNGSNNVWMIGDNIEADVFGAERVGIKSILVRQKDARAKIQFPDLIQLQQFLLKDE